MFRLSVACPTVMLSLFLAGCKVEPPKPQTVKTIAILPFDSEATNINAPDALQRLVYRALKHSSYTVSDIGETNKRLADVGIVDGGQLPALDPVKIAKDFGVQALLYGNVASFGYANIGFYSQRKVALELWLVDGTTGQTIWEHTGSGTTRNFATDSKQAQANFEKSLAEQLVDKLLKNPLDGESRLATLDALRTLPGFLFSGFADDGQSPSDATRGVQKSITDFIRKK